jgi:hypothetical protein
VWLQLVVVVVIGVGGAAAAGYVCSARTLERAVDGLMKNNENTHAHRYQALEWAGGTRRRESAELGQDVRGVLLDKLDEVFKVASKSLVLDRIALVPGREQIDRGIALCTSCASALMRGHRCRGARAG